MCGLTLPLFISTFNVNNILKNLMIACHAANAILELCILGYLLKSKLNSALNWEILDTIQNPYFFYSNMILHNMHNM